MERDSRLREPKIERHKVLLARRVRRWDDDYVLNVAKNVRALVEAPGWAEVQKLIGELRDEQHRAMLELTAIPSQAWFAGTVGVLRGIASAEDAAQVILERAEEIERERVEAEKRQTAAGGGE
jgi:hypothetical protein